MNKPILHLASFNKNIDRKRKHEFSCPLPVPGGELSSEELIEEFWSQFEGGYSESMASKLGAGSYSWIDIVIDKMIKAGKLNMRSPMEGKGELSMQIEYRALTRALDQARGDGNKSLAGELRGLIEQIKLNET